MINLEITPKFQKEHKKFIKNSQTKTKSVSSTLKLFIQNPKHPSLNIEKLKNSDFWTIRIDKANRIFFVWINPNTVLLIDIGSRDKYRRY